jgi:tetratricopeptide (TPR) repeat protein
MKYNSQDIQRLAGQMRRAKEDSEKPFLLLTGAGCSWSAGIPLAGTLVKEIHEQFGEECRHRLAESQLDDYGACMSCLSKNERRTLLEPHLENARLNWAHVAIASLMDAGYVTRVLTFNFDSVLARACGLVGLYPATYDFATAPSAKTDYIATPAVIHLHGQGSGMAMMNSDEETKGHAKNLRSLFRDFLSRAPWLVIGYSGTSDAVFPVLEEVYEGDERFWWAGHEPDPLPHVRRFLKKGGKTAEYVGGADADLFLIDLARELGCFPPKLFTDPYGHLLDELKLVEDFPLQEEAKDQDILAALRNELLDMQKKREASEKPDVTQLFLKGDWDGVIQYANPADKEGRDHLAWAYVGQGTALAELGRRKQDSKFLLEATKKYQAAHSLKPGMYVTLYNWGNALAALAKQKQDPKLFQKASEKFEAAIAIKPDKYWAFNNWGLALFDIARLKEDGQLFEQAAQRFQKAIELRPDVPAAFINWGAALMGIAKIRRDHKLYKEARKLFEKGEALNPDKVYNLACLAAITGAFDESRQRLEHCKVKGTLPPKTHLLEDPDLEPIRDLDWFKDLIADLPD